MATLSMIGASTYRKYEGKACTDITGFGILGHMQNLNDIQNEGVNFVLHKLPMIKNMLKLDGVVHNFKLKQGWSAETSGGLLAIFSKENA